ncbi:hypothetical protein [Phytoactinopolyspora halotolerans]|uniref:Uncharacterized protein n=1 Tax=Phytoactinopolyspora halotolerans TaxID=1981512 RepID=A0A6L9S490_9ACTN|nr:hypothetical protein [Phytoactinopolyspora halotolerans]NED99297.1 hypothetical protein [Phytoactinopolyspora halotolerans]
MERTRKFAASPVRPANATWTQIKDLLAESLERSAAVPDSTVATALGPLDGLVPSLIASGYLATEPLVVVAGDLRLNLYAVRGDAAFDVEENLGPVPGAASSSANWRMYVPSPVHLRDTVAEACTGQDHLISGKPPAATEAADSGSASRIYAIDPAALRQI